MITEVMMLVVGLAVGGVAVWLILKGKIQYAAYMAETEAKSEVAVLTERLQAKDSHIQGLKSQLEEQATANESQRSENTSLKTEQAELKAVLNKERLASQEKLALLDEAQKNYPMPSSRSQVKRSRAITSPFWC